MFIIVFKTCNKEKLLDTENVVQVRLTDLDQKIDSVQLTIPINKLPLLGFLD